MKLLTVACESFNRYDIEATPDPFECFSFDNYPSVNTAMSLCLMQHENTSTGTERPYHTPEMQKAWFPDIRKPGSFVFNFVKTRVISGPFWASPFNPRAFDPEQLIDNRQARRPEPLALHYQYLKDFLRRDFYTSKYRHLIYWTNIGHAGLGCRLGEEERGIPADLKDTFALWTRLLTEEVMPLVDLHQTIVIVMNDHGTRRKNLSYEQAMYDGFLWAFDPLSRISWDKERPITWHDYRYTLCKIFGIDELLSRNILGESFICF